MAKGSDSSHAFAHQEGGYVSCSPSDIARLFAVGRNRIEPNGGGRKQNNLIRLQGIVTFTVFYFQYLWNLPGSSNSLDEWRLLSMIQRPVTQRLSCSRSLFKFSGDKVSQCLCFWG